MTQADTFMGPAVCEVLAEEGAELIADTGNDFSPAALAERFPDPGELDALVVNLAISAPTTALTEVDSSEWREVFAALVDPLPSLFQAVVPGMAERRQGKIVVVGSAAALRGMKRCTTYSAARGAQLAYVQSAGVELAKQGIQVNGVAQNFVENPTYYPESVQQNPRFQERLQREVPLGRLVTAREDARFIAYLCSDAASCFVGQVFPVAGGWAVR